MHRVQRDLSHVSFQSFTTVGERDISSANLQSWPKVEFNEILKEEPMRFEVSRKYRGATLTALTLLLFGLHLVCDRPSIEREFRSVIDP